VSCSASLTKTDLPIVLLATFREEELKIGTIVERQLKEISLISVVPWHEAGEITLGFTVKCLRLDHVSVE
jgi:hypothetical protein